MGALFQISEDDLSDLERFIPLLGDNLMEVLARLDAGDASCKTAATALRMKLRRTKSIISDIRWRYGPPEQIEAISAGSAEDQS